MKLTTNLATRRYINLPQVNLVLLLGFALLVTLALFKVAEIARNAAELSRLETLITGTGQGERSTRVSETQLKAQEARIRFANGAIEKKSVNWLILLDHLEEVVPDGVALTQIAPDQQLLKITGAARSFANLRTLMENMERSQHFSEVYLLSQSDTKVGLTQEGLQFSISCKVALQ